jgi:hypothetical protein
MGRALSGPELGALLAQREAAAIVLGERLRCTRSRLLLRRVEIDSELSAVERRRDRVQQLLLNTDSQKRAAVERLQQAHRDLIAQRAQDFLARGSQLSKTTENAIRYRAAPWDLGAAGGLDQVASLLDLIRFSYSRVPLPEQEPAVYVARSLSASLERAESARMRLETLRMEADTKSRKLGAILEAVQRKTESVKEHAARMQRRYDAGCEALREREEQMKAVLEGEFREILRTHYDRTQKVRRGATRRYEGAKGTLRDLRTAQLRFMELNNPLLRYPTLALEAKLRVAKIILANLKEENERLRRAAEELRQLHRPGE